MQTIDLHTHSDRSDGTLTPAQLAKAAFDAGLTAFALTDHDTVDGLKEALAAAGEISIQHPEQPFFCIPGVELAVSYARRELHIVGLYLDIQAPAFNKALAKIQGNRDRRNMQMIEKMQAAGIDITMEKLRAHQGDGILTRANFAAYLLHTGVIRTLQEGFEKYLNPDKPFYVPRQYMDPQDAIELIHSVGGLAILAHPLLYHFDDTQLEKAVADLKALGLDGLETYYSMNRGYDLQHMKCLAGKYGLICSGGSDFHGDHKPHIKIGRGRGDLFVPADLLKTHPAYHKQF